MRGGVESRNLQWGDMQLCTDEDDDEHFQTKTPKGGDPKCYQKV